MKKIGKSISKPATMLLAVCLLFTSLGMAPAQPCANHTQHDADCGYVAVESAPCTHTCEVCNPPAQTARGITAFAALDAAVQYQDVASGAKMGEMMLPDTLEATVGGQTESITGVMWACAAYNDETGMTESEYEWTPVLPESDTLDLGTDENGTAITPPSIFALVDGAEQEGLGAAGATDGAEAAGLMEPNAAPVINPPGGALPDGMVGVYYQMAFTSSTNDIKSWTASGGLPDVLIQISDDSSTTSYEGVPQVPGDYSFSITATNTNDESISVAYTLKIKPYAESPTAGFGGKQWSVIGGDGTGAAPQSGALTLLSKNHVFGTTMFYHFSSDYNGSDLQSAMSNAAPASGDPERACIIPRTLAGSGSTYTIGTEMAGGDATNQLFWPLSCSEHRAIAGSAKILFGRDYWLRSPGGSSSNVLCGILDGSVRSHLRLYDDAIRPAFWLNLSSVLFTSAATGGKLGAAGPNLSAATPPANFYKFTMVDNTNLSLASVTHTGISGRTITFDYAGATPGKTLSAIVKGSDGTVKFYGKLVDTTAASGTGVQVTLPDSFAAGNTLQIFVEEINGDNYTDFASTPVTLPISAQAPSTYTLTVVNGKDTTNTGPYTSGAQVSIVADAAPAGQVFDKWTGGDGTFANANSATTTFTMPAANVTVTALYKSGGGPTYTYRTLTDPATGVSITGYFAAGASIRVISINLHAEGTCAACDEIRARQAAGEVVILHDISVGGGYRGSIDVSIPVGAQYSGQSVKILHCANGRLETRTVTVAKGKAVGTFSSLSPFAVTKAKEAVPIATSQSTLPQTGDNGNMTLWVVPMLAAVAGIGMLIYRRKKERADRA